MHFPRQVDGCGTGDGIGNHHRHPLIMYTAIEPSLCGRGCLFKESEITVCTMRGLTAHLERWLKVDAHRRPFRFAKQRAALVGCQLDAADAGRLAVRHAGDGRGNGRCNTTGSAAYATLHRHISSFLLADYVYRCCRLRADGWSGASPQQIP